MQINEKEGDFSIRTLSREYRISVSSTNKAIAYCNAGLVSVKIKCGHNREGITSMHALENKHHLHIHELFLENLSCPRLGYAKS